MDSVDAAVQRLLLRGNDDAQTPVADAGRLRTGYAVPSWGSTIWICDTNGQWKGPGKVEGTGDVPYRWFVSVPSEAGTTHVKLSPGLQWEYEVPMPGTNVLLTLWCDHPSAIRLGRIVCGSGGAAATRAEVRARLFFAGGREELVFGRDVKMFLARGHNRRRPC